MVYIVVFIANKLWRQLVISFFRITVYDLNV